jgi:hypothetical protein
MKRPRTAIIAALGALAAISVFAIATPAQGTTAGCVAAPKIGKKVPVLFVHGLFGSPSAWKDMEPAVKAVPDLYFDSTFDYSTVNGHWVDYPAIGPALATRIACLATSSREAGGSGKVILVGHSMGGLATRWAATEAKNSTEVANDIGLAVTIGTPNGGSAWAYPASAVWDSICWPASQLSGNDNICDQMNALHGLRNFSSQIEKLPKWPSGITVEAIAGNVSLAMPTGLITVPMAMGGDLVVSKLSALKYTAQPNFGGGSATISCTSSLTDMQGVVTIDIGSRSVHLGANPVAPDCWHSALTHNQDAENDTIGAIKKYVASTQAFAKYVGSWVSPVASITMVMAADGTAKFTFRGYSVMVRYRAAAKGLKGVITGVTASNTGFKVGKSWNLYAPTSFGGILSDEGNVGDSTLMYRETKLPKSVLEPFLTPGTSYWWVHGMGMTISADSTGVMTWNEGPCGDTPGLCKGTAKLMFDGTSSKGIIGVLMSSEVTLPNGQEPPNYVGSNSDPQPGYVFKLQPGSNLERLTLTWGDDAAFSELKQGNSNWCRSGYSDPGALCGA